MWILTLMNINYLDSFTLAAKIGKRAYEIPKINPRRHD
jgi:hypothetical protein